MLFSQFFPPSPSPAASTVGSSVCLLSQFCLWYSYFLLASLSFLSSFNSHPPPPPCPIVLPHLPVPSSRTIQFFSCEPRTSLVVQQSRIPLQCRRQGDMDSLPGLGRSPEGGNRNPLKYFCLENPMDRGAWWATVQGGQRESDMTEHILVLY